MANDIKQRPNGRWQALVRRGGNYIDSATFDRKKDAEAFVQKVLRQYADGIDPRIAKQKVCVFVEEFQEYRRDHTNISLNTRLADENMFKRVPNWFLQMEVGKVTTKHVQKVLFEDADKHPERTHASLKRCKITLSAFFTYLVTNNVITRNPASGAEVPDGPLVEEAIPWMGSEIFERYAVWSELDEEMAKVALVTYFLATRWGETRALRVRDVRIKDFQEVFVWRSWSEGQAIKTTKTKKHRWIPVADAIRPILQEYAEGREDDEFLFAGLTRAKFRRRLRWKETGQGKVIHSLRHGGITTWIEAGVNVSVAMRWSGHSRAETLEKYCHLVGDRVNQQAIAQVNQFQQKQM